MLERIHSIKGLGLLHDADGRAYGLRKASLIYADNGRGKSTLASLFRSCATNNPDLIVNRLTIGGVNAQEVKLQFSNGHNSIFQNGSWDHGYPELLVFDADFVEKNVYSGGQVSADQRRNLLQFALGSNAVTAQREYDQADRDDKQAKVTVSGIKAELYPFHLDVSLSVFQQMAQVPNVDVQIADINVKVVEANNINQIQAKVEPQLLMLPDIDVNLFFSILNKSLANIDLAAEKQVREHINAHNKPMLEQWVSDGYNYGEEGNCLYCNQSLEGVNLIKAYQSYFNQDYRELKSDVARLEAIVISSCPDSIVDRLKAEFDTACMAINGWQEHVQLILPIFREGMARETLTDLRVMLEGLKQRKQANILESVGLEEDKEAVLEKWQVLLDIVAETNQEIRNAVRKIVDYKNDLGNVDIAMLRMQITDLERAKVRYNPAVTALFTRLTAAQEEKISTQTEKQTKKDALNQVMEETLAVYTDRINELLRSFGAQFKIPSINFNYRSGLRSDYVLKMRGDNITLNGEYPSFSTSLSEGDKRTLAFAFFIASTEADPELANKIIVIDDPMCSLDLNRKQQTRGVIKRIHDNCQQLIILAHDIHFLRSLRNDMLRGGINPDDIKCVQLKAVANNYSNFEDFDIDKECETSYFRSHRVLNDYLEGIGPSSMEVAKSIRPMLEGYLHRRFPNKIARDLLFGQVVRLIENAVLPSPLVHAQNITTELNEINRYAGQFHHDTNPAVDQVDVIDGELRTFVTRALEVVYKGVT